MAMHPERKYEDSDSARDACEGGPCWTCNGGGCGSESFKPAPRSDAPETDIVLGQLSTSPGLRVGLKLFSRQASRERPKDSHVCIWISILIDVVRSRWFLEAAADLRDRKEFRSCRRWRDFTSGDIQNSLVRTSPYSQDHLGPSRATIVMESRVRMVLIGRIG